MSSGRESSVVNFVVGETVSVGGAFVLKSMGDYLATLPSITDHFLANLAHAATPLVAIGGTLLTLGVVAGDVIKAKRSEPKFVKKIV